MANKLKSIVNRALAIREKAGFTTETIVKKRYKMAYIPDAIKQAATELNSKEKPKRTKRVVKTKKLANKVAQVVVPAKRTRRVVSAKALIKKAAPVAKSTPLVMKQEHVRILNKKFIHISSKGKDFKSTYGVSAMSLLKKTELDSNKHIDIEIIYTWMTKRQVANHIDFNCKLVEELAKNGKCLTGKRTINLEYLGALGYEFNHADRVPPKGRAGMYGLDKIVQPLKSLTRPEYSAVFVDDGNLVATDANKLIVIKDSENQAKKYNGKIVGIQKGNLNTVIDGRYPNYNSVLPQMDRLPHVTSWVEIDEILPGLNGRVLILKSISDSMKYVVLSIKGNNIAVKANFLLDILVVLKANGAKKIKIGSSDSSRAILLQTDNGNTGLLMPMLVKDIKDRENFTVKQINL